MRRGRVSVGLVALAVIVAQPIDSEATFVDGEDRLIVWFSSSMDETARTRLHRSLGADVVDQIPQLDAAIVEAPHPVLERYRNAAGIIGAIEDFPVYLHDVDPDFYRQWGLENEGQPIGADGHHPVEPAPEALGGSPGWDIDVRAAWSRSRGDGALVAVIDTGVDDQHPEFAGRLESGASFVEQGADCDEMFPGRGPTDDTYGHGTHVAGIIAAAADNGIGGTGVAPSARILPIKVTDCTGALGTFSSITQAIVWAADAGADVINLSLGYTFIDPTEFLGIPSPLAYAVEQGALPVCSAGNNSAPMVNMWPAFDEACVSVIAVGRAGTRASFSSYGAGADVAAPGLEIFSTVPERPSCVSQTAVVSSCNRGFPSGFAFSSGTSMAAPMVAGAAALLSATGSGPTEIRARLEETAAQPDGSSGVWTPDYGWGLINVARALGVDAAPGPIAPKVDPSGVGSGPLPTDLLVYRGQIPTGVWNTGVFHGTSSCPIWDLVFNEPVELIVRWGGGHPYSNEAATPIGMTHQIIMVGSSGVDLHYSIETRTLDGRLWPGWSYHAPSSDQDGFCDALRTVPQELRFL